MVHGPADGLHPVLHHFVRGVAAGKARQNIPDDGRRFFGPGIVGGDHRKVGPVRRRLAHAGALGLVTVAAAAEHRHGAALGKFLHRLQHVHHAVRRVGVVNEDGIVLAGGGDYLHPALHMGDLGQNSSAVLQGNAQRQCGPQHIQRIIHHKAAGDIHPDGYPLGFCHRVKGDAVSRQHHVFRPEVRLGLDAVGAHLTGGILQQPGRPRIVTVHHADAAVPEQNGLGIAVVFHRYMEIQMILGQIGEDTHRIVNAVDPVQTQGVGGGLHHRIGAPGVRHLPEEPLDLKGFRRGAVRRDDLLPDHVLIGTDKAHLGPPCLL